MFHEHLFTVDVLRRPVAKRPVALCGYEADGQQKFNLVLIE